MLTKLFIIALSIFFFDLYACMGGYDTCKLKVNDSDSISNNTLQIPVLNKYRLVFSQTTPKEKIIKQDPFLSLYLIEDRSGFKYPFRINRHISSGIAYVDKQRACEGKIIKKQIGLNSFATFNQKLDAPALLLSSCCAVEGIVTKKGIIQKEYIKRFLDKKDITYSDIGVRVKEIGLRVFISKTDPFLKHFPLQKGDEVLKFDRKKIKSASIFMRDILFSKTGSVHTITVKRESKILKYNLKSYKRYGGGYLSDTFLERFGLYFDENLSIVKIEPKAKKYNLKKGDRLIKSEKKVLEADTLYLLFEREGFEFFIKIPLSS